jgi:transposase-like protein
MNSMTFMAAFDDGPRRRIFPDRSVHKNSGLTRGGTSQWKALRTTNALERITEEFRRRTKTQASLPSEEAVLFLLFGLLRSGQVRLRRLVGWQDLASSQMEAA